MTIFKILETRKNALNNFMIEYFNPDCSVSYYILTEKKWKLHELISHLYEAEWKHFSLTMKQLFFYFQLLPKKLFLLPIWFRDPVNPKQREIAKICQMMKKITL